MIQCPVVIVMAERQRDKVERLVRYCDSLDGTKIEVVEYGQERTSNRHLAAHLSFRLACRLFQKTAFFWIEADAIPLQPGWKDKICSEHNRRRKSFTLPSIAGLSRYDVASGIGIYPRDARSFIPEGKQPRFLAWDHWLFVKRKRFINFTILIQHSYGLYDPDRWALLRRHSFPRDNNILRPNSLLFHADPEQSLIQ